MALAGSRDRGEGPARAILLTPFCRRYSGLTSPRIAEAFSVREDTVRLCAATSAAMVK
jgi:hypothetical protein